MNRLVVMLCVCIAVGCAGDNLRPTEPQVRKEALYSCAQIRHQLERESQRPSTLGSSFEITRIEQWAREHCYR